MLAGAINTAPLIPEWAGPIQLDQAPRRESGGGQMDEHWDLGLLGISQVPFCSTNEFHDLFLKRTSLWLMRRLHEAFCSPPQNLLTPVRARLQILLLIWAAYWTVPTDVLYVKQKIE